MTTTPSLFHGNCTNIIREGFSDDRNPYKEIKKAFQDNASFITYPDGTEVDMTSAMDEAVDNYQKLYCLKAGTPNEIPGADTTKWNFGEQVGAGEPIRRLAGTGDDGGNCVKPNKWKVEHGDKILKNGNNYYYVNKYGYIKKINPNSPLCTQKDIIRLQNPPNMGDYKRYSYDNISMRQYTNNEHIQGCNSGNYNLRYCKNGNCNHAYFSPSGKLKKYGNHYVTDKNGNFKPTSTKAVQDTACYALPVKDSSMSFLPADGSNPQWSGQHIHSDKFNNLSEKDFDQKTSSVMNCFPYVENDNAQYVTNLSNKIKSDLKMRYIEDQFVDESNKLLKMHEDIELQNQRMLRDDGHATANKYMAQMKKLQKLREKLESTKDYKMTVSKINSEELQRYMWVGSALALGAISLKLISSI